MSERRKIIDQFSAIQEKFRGSARFLDQHRPQVANFTDFDRDRLILVSTGAGALSGIMLDYASALMMIASKGYYQASLPAPFWQMVFYHPIETVIVTTCVPLIASTACSLLVKEKPATPKKS